MISVKSGCPVSKSAKARRMTQEMVAVGNRLRSIPSKGSVCTTSPKALGLIRQMRCASTSSNRVLGIRKGIAAGLSPEQGMGQEETRCQDSEDFLVSQFRRIYAIGKRFLTFAISLAKVRPAFRLGPDARCGTSAGKCVF